MSEDGDDSRETVMTQIEVPYSVTSGDWERYKKNTLASEISEVFFKSEIPKWIPNPVYFTHDHSRVHLKGSLLEHINEIPGKMKKRLGIDEVKNEFFFS